MPLEVPSVTRLFSPQHNQPIPIEHASRHHDKERNFARPPAKHIRKTKPDPIGPVRLKPERRQPERRPHPAQVQHRLERHHARVSFREPEVERRSRNPLPDTTNQPRPPPFSMAQIAEISTRREEDSTGVPPGRPIVNPEKDHPNPYGTGPISEAEADAKFLRSLVMVRERRRNGARLRKASDKDTEIFEGGSLLSATNEDTERTNIWSTGKRMMVVEEEGTQVSRPGSRRGFLQMNQPKLTAFLTKRSRSLTIP